MMAGSNFWQGRLKAAGIHFGISLLIAALAALLVFFVWYPYPYSKISGGRELFFIVVAVDVIMGPLMTLAVFNLAKPRTELIRDLAIISLLQLAALGYGLWTVSAARPVHLVYEIDRFRVVHAVDIPSQLMEKAAPEFRQLPLTGPTLLSVRDFKNNNESIEATMLALEGLQLGMRPDLWRDYGASKAQVLTHARPLAELKKRFPQSVADIDAALQKASGTKARSLEAVAYVPMIGRDLFWTVLVDSNTTEVIAFVPIDSF